MSRNGSGLGVAFWLWCLGIVLWCGSVELRLHVDRQWRRDATGLLRDMGTVVQHQQECISRLSVRVAWMEPLDNMDRLPSFDSMSEGDANDVQLIQAAIKAAEEY